jgi:hypothetical protein
VSIWRNGMNKMTNTEAISLVEEELKNINGTFLNKNLGKWWSRWTFKEFDIFLNFHRGFSWNEDKGVSAYSGWGVTVEKFDTRINSPVAMFYIDIENFHI